MGVEKHQQTPLPRATPHSFSTPAEGAPRAGDHGLIPAYRRFPGHRPHAVPSVAEADIGQNRTRRPSWSARGSPTAVIWPNVGDGFVG